MSWKITPNGAVQKTGSTSHVIFEPLDFMAHLAAMITLQWGTG
jgi:2-keto-4-pentenoate hydratase/2-oxohepta-3-ene-1,7-dioic acid hydratase in catechol pathway